MPHDTLYLFAPAKLNLFLHVTGKRVDGYHTLQSAIVFVDVGDELTLSRQDEFSIDIEGPFAASLGDPEENLVCKAARLLAGYYKIPLSGKITLIKNLPAASGLGGGSTDAAAALQGLAKLWNLPDDPFLLPRLAQQLGADVPACLYKKPVWAEGIGEKLTILPDMPALHFVLANPLVPTPTPEVFRRFCGPFSQPLRFSGRRDWSADLKTCRNDLTEAAVTVTPVIREVLAGLAATAGCRLCRLSGSGATCFGVYSTAGDAVAAAQTLKTSYPNWWIVKADMLASSGI